MANELVTLERYLLPHEAHLIQGMLEGEGIVAVIQDENLSQLYGGAIGGVRLQVAEEDLVRARALVESLALPPEGDAS